MKLDNAGDHLLNVYKCFLLDLFSKFLLGGSSIDCMGMKDRVVLFNLRESKAEDFQLPSFL